MKSGIDYFPVTVCFGDDFDLIEAKYGVEGLGILIHIYQKIYGGEGYYTRWDSGVSQIFAYKNSLNKDVLDSLIIACVDLGIFDSFMYENYGILTSKEIQERYLEITRKRKNVSVETKFLLTEKGLNRGKTDLNSENGGIFDENGGIFDENGGSFRQSKVKESKEKESEVKESEGEKSKEKEKNEEKREKPAHAPLKMGKYENVLLSEEDLRQFKGECDEWEEYIQRLSAYMASTGREYANHLATLRNWLRDDREKGKNIAANLSRQAPAKKKNPPSYDMEEFHRRCIEEPIVYKKRGV